MCILHIIPIIYRIQHIPRVHNYFCNHRNFDNIWHMSKIIFGNCLKISWKFRVFHICFLQPNVRFMLKIVSYGIKIRKTAK